MGNAQINATGTVTSPINKRLRPDGSEIGEKVVARFVVHIDLRESSRSEVPDAEEIAGAVEEALAEIGWELATVTIKQTDGDR